MTVLRRVAQLIGKVPAREWPDVVAALATVTAVEIGLRATTLPRLASWLKVPLSTENASESRDVPVLSPVERRRVRAALRVTRHWPFGDACLRQALVIGRRLRRRRPLLRVGVAKIDGQIRAHAWVVIGAGVLDPLGSASSYVGLEPVRP